MNAAGSSWRTLENVEVECTHCGIRMTLQMGNRVRYYRCSGCHRWVSSTYTDVLRADAKVRTHPVKDSGAQDERFIEVKDRLERWLSAIEDQDPYHLLGVSPLDSPEKVRARYHALALERHPDRGGSVEKMRELNVAYERILRHQQRKRQEALTAGASVASASALPARSR
ncbi:DnaJ domain-containing protein [Myxococcus stipitatus DSM 14675]|uniref:DnaJ domain-containing protein n=1 Tax=Myxococcus stipitatus (strain DSM 14675 / JCM 12634 / Mx s8) TaxID=1278073 RepID=L7UBE3_MYXSD|nr:J domain-containing protein [Myxococcus stipitatus]AGC44892.1 DnaJ domain-containing protein [Myxococcus stipitatus DSM 14675]